MKPQRLIVTHARTSSGQDLFTVSQNRRGSRMVASEASTLGHSIISQTARFDFTLSTWGLPLDARWVPCQMAAKALASASQPKAPRTPRAGRTGRGRVKGGPAFTAPKPTSADAKLTVLAALEDLFVLQLRDKGITPEARTQYEKYTKLKALALGPTSSTAAATEANSALRMATVSLLKITF